MLAALPNQSTFHIGLNGSFGATFPHRATAALGRVESVGPAATANAHSRPGAVLTTVRNEATKISPRQTAIAHELEECPSDANRQQARMSTGCIEALIFGAHRERAEFVLGTYTASAARIRAI
jgi:hypothetical protein